MTERIIDIDWCVTHESFQVNPGVEWEGYESPTCWSWEMGNSETTNPRDYPRDCVFVEAQVHYKEVNHG